MQPPLFKTGCEHRRNGHHWVQDTENKTTTHYSEMLVVIEERTNLRRKEKIPCNFRYGYFVAINQIVMSTVHIL